MGVSLMEASSSNHGLITPKSIFNTLPLAGSVSTMSLYSRSASQLASGVLGVRKIRRPCVTYMLT